MKVCILLLLIAAVYGRSPIANTAAPSRQATVIVDNQLDDDFDDFYNPFFRSGFRGATHFVPQPYSTVDFSTLRANTDPSNTNSYVVVKEHPYDFDPEVYYLVGTVQGSSVRSSGATPYSGDIPTASDQVGVYVEVDDDNMYHYMLPGTRRHPHVQAYSSALSHIGKRPARVRSFSSPNNPGTKNFGIFMDD